jgi:precorrin-8X/cobalt-precorrin-8 methylmutase
MTCVIILCHGSRGERAVAELPVKMQGIVNATDALLPGSVEVAWAALQFNHPNLEETVASMVASGAKSIFIMPYFLFSGRHIDEDIPETIEALANRYPGVAFTLTKTLGDEERFIPQVIERIREVAPELWLETSISLTHSEDIERRSMEIIEQLLPPKPRLSGEERAVVKQIIHASGDPQAINCIRFSPAAASGGIHAIQNGSPIFTDVRMVATGINSRMAEACCCPILCALDETEGGNGSARKSTRVAAAIKYLGRKMNGAVIAIGNAPTALIALVDSIDNDGIKPALVIGMPVGFVQAAESKEALMKRQVPYITVTGTRGGSAMAAATVNALLKLALENK